jgi:hypothetical protein
MLFACFLSNVVVGALIKAKALDAWISMVIALAPLPLLLIAFKFYCVRTFDDQIHYYTKGFMNKEAGIAADNASRRSNNVAIRFGHPALYKPLMTPMVHAKAQHMLSQVYRGRLDDDDTASLAGFSDTYSLRDMKKNGKTGKTKPSGPFEFVDESDMDFQNFKNRDDFRGEHGGDGELYGRPEDIIRGATPASRSSSAGPEAAFKHGHMRSSSRDSERTLQDVPLAGVMYPAGYHTTPSSGLRGYSPSPDRSGLVHGAAPMGAADGYRGAAVVTPGSDGTPGDEQTSYDYFRGRR